MRHSLGLGAVCLSFAGMLYSMGIFFGKDFIGGGLVWCMAFNLGLAGVDAMVIRIEEGESDLEN